MGNIEMCTAAHAAAAASTATPSNYVFGLYVLYISIDWRIAIRQIETFYIHKMLV